MKYLTRTQTSGVASLIVNFVAVVGLVALLSSTAQAQQYKKITRIGTSQAVCASGVETVADLQTYFAENPDAIRAVLADSGWTGSADDLLAAVANGEVSERAYPVGTQVAWMGAKVNGKYVAKPYREWAGSASLDSFQVNVSSDCQVYELMIPKACCNVSLVAVEADNSAECSPAAAATEAAPAPVASKAAGFIPFFGAFVGTETRPRFEVEWQMDMKDSSSIAGVRAGLMKGISPKTSLFGQLSYYDRQGINEYNTYPEKNIGIDFGVERRLSEKAFIGGGIGAWNVDDSEHNDASLFGHVGGDIGKSKLQWFLEGRVFNSDSDMDSISDNKMFSAGIRYLVK